MRPIISTIALVAATTLAGCAGVSHDVAPANASAHVAASPSVGRIVEGDLDISNETSLERFENLEIVTGTLTVAGNTRLQNLDGLERLRAVKHLVIRENLGLTDIQGLHGLRHAKSVTIEKNPRLENLHGLESLKKLDRLVVADNGIFCTSGVGGLMQVGELVVSRNRRLLSLRGFSNLDSADTVTIVDNPRVSARTGFLLELRRVTGKLEIQRNAGLRPHEVQALERRIDHEARAQRGDVQPGSG
jgi:hypothetical protein